MAMQWLHNREDAEDAVQDAVLSAFTHLASFEGLARTSSWLMSVVINAVKMQLRKKAENGAARPVSRGRLANGCGNDTRSRAQP
jgi:RNA polymerase sigma factor (sigma-70 family)